MKKLLNKAGELLSYIVLTPLCILFGIGLVLYIPVDYVRYRRSAFFRDTRRRYELYSGNTQWIRLYNAMRAENLPLEYHLRTTEDIHYGYFRYRNILLVQDYTVEYDPKKQEWFAYYDEEDQQACTTVGETLECSVESYNEIVGQNICDRAVLLIDRAHIPEEDLPRLESCDLLLGYDGNKGMAAAIKQWIEKNRG